MPGEMKPSDAFAAEVAAHFGVRGRLRRRIEADVRKRLLAAEAEERALGASEAEAYWRGSLLLRWGWR